MRAEDILHEQVCTWLKWQHPGLIFTFDPAGIRMTMGQARRYVKLKSPHKMPDIHIVEPRGQYHGCYIELKAQGCSPFKADGTLKKNDHTLQQADTIERLRKKGYFAQFAVGYDEAIELLTHYLDIDAIPKQTPRDHQRKEDKSNKGS